MPCNSDYLSPTQSEINLSVVYGLLDELNLGQLPKNFGQGSDPRVYNRHLSKNHLDEKTEELCSKLQAIDDVSKYSLELQIWWRDHQKADAERLAKELKDIKDEEVKTSALAKLNPYERKLLGL
jgi:hypothetical protein